MQITLFQRSGTDWTTRHRRCWSIKSLWGEAPFRLPVLAHPQALERHSHSLTLTIYVFCAVLRIRICIGSLGSRIQIPMRVKSRICICSQICITLMRCRIRIRIKLMRSHSTFFPGTRMLWLFSCRVSDPMHADWNPHAAYQEYESRNDSSPEVPSNNILAGRINDELFNGFLKCFFLHKVLFPDQQFCLFMASFYIFRLT